MGHRLGPQVWVTRNKSIMGVYWVDAGSAGTGPRRTLMADLMYRPITDYPTSVAGLLRNTQ